MNPLEEVHFSVGWKSQNKLDNTSRLMSNCIYVYLLDLKKTGKKYNAFVYLSSIVNDPMYNYLCKRKAVKMID